MLQLRADFWSNSLEFCAHFWDFLLAPDGTLKTKGLLEIFACFRQPNAFQLLYPVTSDVANSFHILMYLAAEESPRKRLV
jgi:hypothetical protein